MEVTEQTALEFAQVLIMRGFGLYGDEKMMKICLESGINCDEDGTFNSINKEEMIQAVTRLMINYSKFNLPAKMTSIVLARKYGLPIPDELKSSKTKKSKYKIKIES
ncbi:MAG TPA: hypothetical protein VMZ29_03385 [Candidatus Bathyarchaeia archaeon]|nr:hypothetical protein [Candidatus Bathyarchaeia archaeon]